MFWRRKRKNTVTVSDVTFEVDNPPTDEQIKMIDLLPQWATYVDLDQYEESTERQ